ncbi:hypothetical protein HZA45_00360 [Candidatus Peregrinibacteria bacterium]|nr:hypothetical protein [Candidatus Peregrinibacteria bacterium]
MLHLLGALFGIVLATATAPQTQAVPLSQWVPQTGAVFLVDTKDALGYLINTDGSFTAVPVILGQNRNIHYLGRTYLATTPEASWVVKKVDTQSDRIMFGKDGTFLRLFKNGVSSTPYGIHTNANIDNMLASDSKYYSYGCILVTKNVLDILEKMYEANDGSLRVVTMFGLDGEKMSRRVEGTASVKPQTENASRMTTMKS